MASSRKPFHKYPAGETEPEKYVPSFFLNVQFDKQTLEAEVRPLSKDKGYFTVSINHVFLAHIHKVNSEWLDFIGGKDELYQAVGAQIDEHFKNF